MAQPGSQEFQRLVDDAYDKVYHLQSGIPLDVLAMALVLNVVDALEALVQKDPSIGLPLALALSDQAQEIVEGSGFVAAGNDTVN